MFSVTHEFMLLGIRILLLIPYILGMIEATTDYVAFSRSVTLTRSPLITVSCKGCWLPIDKADGAESRRDLCACHRSALDDPMYVTYCQIIIYARDYYLEYNHHLINIISIVKDINTESIKEVS